MNVNKCNAAMKRHIMQIKGAMTSDNPYHNQHIEDFCDYADAIAREEAQEVREEVPGIVQQAVQQEMASRKIKVEVDKESARKAKAVFDDFAKSLRKLFK